MTFIEMGSTGKITSLGGKNQDLSVRHQVGGIFLDIQIEMSHR